MRGLFVAVMLAYWGCGCGQVILDQPDGSAETADESEVEEDRLDVGPEQPVEAGDAAEAAEAAEVDVVEAEADDAAGEEDAGPDTTADAPPSTWAPALSCDGSSMSIRGFVLEGEPYTMRACTEYGCWYRVRWSWFSGSLGRVVITSSGCFPAGEVPEGGEVVCHQIVHGADLVVQAIGTPSVPLTLGSGIQAEIQEACP